MMGGALHSTAKVCVCSATICRKNCFAPIFLAFPVFSKLFCLSLQVLHLIKHKMEANAEDDIQVQASYANLEAALFWGDVTESEKSLRNLCQSMTTCLSHIQVVLTCTFDLTFVYF